MLEDISPFHQLDRKLANQQNGSMKTTVDLPETLLRRVKLRALRDGRKLKDTMAELIRLGLDDAMKPRHLRKAKVVKDKLTGLPVIVCPRPAPPGEELTPDRVAEILLEQEVEWAHVASR
jgi:hypothetical protein